MTTFRTKYNYLILALRFAFILFFIALFIGFCLYAAPKLLQSEQPLYRKFIGIPLGTFLLLFLIYRFAKILSTQRNTFHFEGSDLILTDAITKRRKIIPKSQIKGFSLTNYPTKAWNFKEILIYFHSGTKIELPQFLYLNFKEMKQYFEDNDLTFLVFELLIWKFLDSRHYQFD